MDKGQLAVVHNAAWTRQDQVIASFVVHTARLARTSLGCIAVIYHPTARTVSQSWLAPVWKADHYPSTSS